MATLGEPLNLAALLERLPTTIQLDERDALLIDPDERDPDDTLHAKMDLGQQLVPDSLSLTSAISLQETSSFSPSQAQLALLRENTAQQFPPNDPNNRPIEQRKACQLAVVVQILVALLSDKHEVTSFWAGTAGVLFKDKISLRRLENNSLPEYLAKSGKPYFVLQDEADLNRIIFHRVLRQFLREIVKESSDSMVIEIEALTPENSHLVVAVNSNWPLPDWVRKEEATLPLHWPYPVIGEAARLRNSNLFPSPLRDRLFASSSDLLAQAATRSNTVPIAQFPQNIRAIFGEGGEEAEIPSTKAGSLSLIGLNRLFETPSIQALVKKGITRALSESSGTKGFCRTGSTIRRVVQISAVYPPPPSGVSIEDHLESILKGLHPDLPGNFPLVPIKSNREHGGLTYATLPLGAQLESKDSCMAHTVLPYTSQGRVGVAVSVLYELLNSSDGLRARTLSSFISATVEHLPLEVASSILEIVNPVLSIRGKVTKTNKSVSPDDFLVVPTNSSSEGSGSARRESMTLTYPRVIAALEADHPLLFFDESRNAIKSALATIMAAKDAKWLCNFVKGNHSEDEAGIRARHSVVDDAAATVSGLAQDQARLTQQANLARATSEVKPLVKRNF
ncbi:hypothetical protein JCM16303_000652 [Sporobolomyces ruberrimus]